MTVEIILLCIGLGLLAAILFFTPIGLSVYLWLQNKAIKKATEQFKANLIVKNKKLVSKAQAAIKEERRQIEDAWGELAEAEEAATKEVIQQLKEADEQIAAKIEEVERKNLINFKCPCGKSQVPVVIDLSSADNSFICTECQNEYKIHIQLTPILRGKIVNEQALYGMLREKTDEGEV